MRIVITDDEGAVVETHEVRSTPKETTEAVEDGLGAAGLVRCWSCDAWLPPDDAVEHDADFYCRACDERRREARRAAGRTEVPEQ